MGATGQGGARPGAAWRKGPGSGRLGLAVRGTGVQVPEDRALVASEGPLKSSELNPPMSQSAAMSFANVAMAISPIPQPLPNVTLTPKAKS